MKNEECRELDKVSAGATLIILISFLIYLFFTNIKFFFAVIFSFIVIFAFANDCEENENE